MKKFAFLTAITFSLLFSSNCWGEWTKVISKPSRANFYVDFDKIKQHAGYIYFWRLKTSVNLDTVNMDHRSNVAYFKSDCNVGKLKMVALILYSQSMGKGNPLEIRPEHFEKYLGSNNWKYPSQSMGKGNPLETQPERFERLSGSNNWKYPAPGTVNEIMMDKVCKNMNK